MRCVVTIADGVVTGVVVDGPGMESLVFLDYDVERGDAPDMDPDGVPCIVSLHGPADMIVDPAFVRKVCGDSVTASRSKENRR